MRAYCGRYEGFVEQRRTDTLGGSSAARDGESVTKRPAMELRKLPALLPAGQVRQHNQAGALDH